MQLIIFKGGLEVACKLRITRIPKSTTNTLNLRKNKAKFQAYEAVPAIVIPASILIYYFQSCLDPLTFKSFFEDRRDEPMLASYTKKLQATFKSKHEEKDHMVTETR